MVFYGKAKPHHSAMCINAIEVGSQRPIGDERFEYNFNAFILRFKIRNKGYYLHREKKGLIPKNILDIIQHRWHSCASGTEEKKRNQLSNIIYVVM